MAPPHASFPATNSPCSLSELLRGVDIDIPGGSVRIVEVELKGDASQSLRRGKRLVFFEFAITAKWEGELIDARTGAVLGTGASASVGLSRPLLRAPVPPGQHGDAHPPCVRRRRRADRARH